MVHPTTLLLLADMSEMNEVAADKYAKWLGDSERRRSNAFTRDERRRQFIAGRALLRSALAELFGIMPADIALTERFSQCPELTFPLMPHVGFSISHSGKWVACAVSNVSKVGLDIERIDKSRDVLALAENVFTSTDLAVLANCSEHQRHECFYRMWCSYEAKFKLGQKSAVNYQLDALEVAGALACATPLARAPVFTLVQFHLM